MGKLEGDKIMELIGDFVDDLVNVPQCSKCSGVGGSIKTSVGSRPNVVDIEFERQCPSCHRVMLDEVWANLTDACGEQREWVEQRKL